MPLSSLFSRTRRLSLAGITDWHSHILPGVDDGIHDMETALDVLDDYEKAGIRQVWLTPHIMEDVPNATANLKRRFNELMSAYRGKVIVRLASENMIDSLFHERLEANDFLPIGNRHDMLLVETTVFNAPLDFEYTLCEIRSKGYYPLLAHPERYGYLQSLNEYRHLKELGARFQLNLLSLDGAYGKAVQRKAQDLLRHGMYDHIGSDLHRLQQTEHMTNLTLSSADLKALGKLKDETEFTYGSVVSSIYRRS